MLEDIHSLEAPLSCKGYTVSGSTLRAKIDLYLYVQHQKKGCDGGQGKHSGVI